MRLVSQKTLHVNPYEPCPDDEYQLSKNPLDPGLHFHSGSFQQCATIMTSDSPFGGTWSLLYLSLMFSSVVRVAPAFCELDPLLPNYFNFTYYLAKNRPPRLLCYLTTTKRECRVPPWSTPEHDFGVCRHCVEIEFQHLSLYKFIPGWDQMLFFQASIAQ